MVLGISETKSRIQELINRMYGVREQQLALARSVKPLYEQQVKGLEKNREQQREEVETEYEEAVQRLTECILARDPFSTVNGIEFQRLEDRVGKLSEAIRKGDSGRFGILLEGLPAILGRVSVKYFERRQFAKRKTDEAIRALSKRLDERRLQYERAKQQLDIQREGALAEFVSEESERVKQIQKDTGAREWVALLTRDAALAKIDQAIGDRRQAVVSAHEGKARELKQEAEAGKAVAQRLHQLREEKITRAYTYTIGEINKDDKSESLKLEKELKLGLSELEIKRRALSSRLTAVAHKQPHLELWQRSWTDARWQPFSSPTTPPTNGKLRLGRKHIGTPVGEIELPVLIPFLGESHLWVSFSEKDRDKIVTYSISLLLRLLAAYAPGQMSVLLYDPKGFGYAFKTLSNILPEKLFKVVYKSQALEQELERLLDRVVQINKAIGHSYTSAFEMNADQRRFVHSNTVVLINDFPTSLDKKALSLLDGVGRSGHMSGLHIFGLIDEEALRFEEDLRPDPSVHGNLIYLEGGSLYFQDLEATHHHINSRPRDHRYTSEHPVKLLRKPKGRKFYPDVPYSKNFPQTILEEIKERLESPRYISKRFVDNLPGADEVGQETSASQLRVPIGINESNELIHLRLDSQESVHTFILGKTGFGKSTLLHEIILGLASRYPPTELQFVLLDDKHGVEFGWYRDFLPHVTLLELKKDAHFALAILEYLVSEMTERNRTFEECKVRDIGAFKSQFPERDLPRIVMIWDNAYEVFKQDEALSDQVLSLLGRLARDGRSAGIHMVLVTNHLQGLDYNLRGILSQFSVRINLVNDEDSSVFETHGTDWRKTIPKKKGEAQCVGLENDSQQYGQLVRFFELNLSQLGEKNGIDALIRDMMVGYPPPAPKVLIAGELADAGRHQIYFDQASAQTADPVIWLGEPAAIANPVGVILSKEISANVLAVGKKELFSPLMALALEQLTTHLPLRTTVHFFGPDEVDQTTNAVFDRIRVRPDVGKIERLGLDQFIEFYSRCADVDSSLQRHVFFIWNFELLSELRDKARDNFESGELWDGLSRNFQFAPQKGVHLFAWTSTSTGLASLISPQEISDIFKYRMVSDTDRETMRNVADDGWYQKLGDKRAVLFDRNSRPTVFAPFSPERALYSDEPNAEAG